MKNSFSAIVVMIWAFIQISSCHELDETMNDYLPLKVGEKYKYDYLAYYSYVYENSTTFAECTWDFIGVSGSDPVVYQVKQTLNGRYVYKHYDFSGGVNITKTDTTQIKNQISTLSFAAMKNGQVTFTFIVPYWGNTSLTFNRFIQTDKVDTCLTIELINQVCLKRNVGITSFGAGTHGNHSGSVCYSLIKGPY